MEQPQPQKTEEYKGPGRVWSAFGGWGVGGLVGGLVALPFRWQSMKSLFKGEGIKSIGIWTASSMAILATSIIGAVIGWNKAKDGEEQHRSNQAKLAIAENESGHLKQVITVQEENQKRFTDAVTSRKQEGSHASAVEADKQQASGASISA